MKSKVYMHSSESMPEAKDSSVDLLLGPSVYLTNKNGQCANWIEYVKLYQKVYIQEGLRILKPSGIFLVIQTNAYSRGEFICRYVYLTMMLGAAGYKLIDERVWKRSHASHFQVPFSHVLAFIPPGGTAKRSQLNNRSRLWFQGVWDCRQNRNVDASLNAYPRQLCGTIVDGCTDKGDLIVDPFAGTGALLDVAHFMKRRAIGYEIDEKLIPTLQGNGCDVYSCDSHGETRKLAPKEKGLII